MIFAPSGRCFSFEIPDDWWSAAGMTSFRRASSRYSWREDPDRQGFPIVTVPLASILRGPRNRECGDFDRNRMVSVLSAIATNQALPPVLVVPLVTHPNFSHRLYDGFHRFSASIAAGFLDIPVIVVEPI